VGIVGLESEIVEPEMVLDTHFVDKGEAGPFVDKRTEHVALEIGTRRLVKTLPEGW